MGGEKVEYLSEYRKWVDSPYIDEYTKKELWDIENNEEGKGTLLCYSCFGRPWGLMGAGVNRMTCWWEGPP